MTATSSPSGPPTAADTAVADVTLDSLRQEWEALHAQLLELRQRTEQLADRLRAWEAAHAAPAPGGPAEQTPSLGDLINALVRGADSPELGAGIARGTSRPARSRRTPFRILGLVATAGLLAAAGLLLRLLF